MKFEEAMRVIDGATDADELLPEKQYAVLREVVAEIVRKVAGDERRRAVRIAREEARRLCADPDSIQYRVGDAIAKAIKGD